MVFWKGSKASMPLIKIVSFKPVGRIKTINATIPGILIPYHPDIFY
jgi:hypothetical protein